MSVYCFDDLLHRRELIAPPLIHLHVQKAGGSTLNGLLMKNYKFRASSRGVDFIPRFTREEITALAGPPRSEDDRVRPAFFTGHIDLDNEVFRLMPDRYVAVAVLREPVARVISHYRFNSTQPSIFQDSIRNERLSVIDYHRKFADAIGTQYGVFSPTGSIDDAIRRLEGEISYYGLASSFGEFAAALSMLLGFQTTAYKTLNKTAEDAIEVSQRDADELRSILSDDINFYRRASALYENRQRQLPKNIATHPWSKFYS